MTCPLCLHTEEFYLITGPDTRVYNCCSNCMLIFVTDAFLPSPEQEKERYLLHENTLENTGYTEFLSNAVVSAKTIYKQGMRLLDFGCGPNPVLSFLLAKEEIECLNFDPFFFPEMPAGTFDIILSIETLEHFFQPAYEIEQIHKILNNAGYLLIMTKLWNSLAMFKDWSYARDYTHVRFYHEKSMEFIAKNYGFKKSGIGDSGVFLFQKT